VMNIIHPDANISIEGLPNGLKQLRVIPTSPLLFIPRKSCQTSYSLELIELILKIKGPGYLCDEIARDEDPTYVQRDLEVDLAGYFPLSAFEGKRILDFGCGSGASTMILSRLFPRAEIVGIELDKELLSVAHARARHYQSGNVEFLVSPDGDRLPRELGMFDVVILSAVYEHLLPQERQAVMPKVWNTISPGGFLFLNMTPNRLFPMEHHTTGLPLINYLPDGMAMSLARKFSRRIDKTEPWETLLRRGIRGGTEVEVLNNLQNGGGRRGVLMAPKQAGMKDRIDLWYSALDPTRMLFVKKLLKAALKTVQCMSGSTLVPNLSLVVRKT